jgi:hypothetical protein
MGGAVVLFLQPATGQKFPKRACYSLLSKKK